MFIKLASIRNAGDFSISSSFVNLSVYKYMKQIYITFYN